ncbi:hypothetical protein Ais01nite_33760 [Asanoa ishikariensis]|nr:hypothetical protein Ais01nite_33760 [Asanoa ishikariensis]
MDDPVGRQLRGQQQRLVAQVVEPGFGQNGTHQGPRGSRRAPVGGQAYMTDVLDLARDALP